MKNTKKLLVVFLALAIVLSSIAVTTLTTSAAAEYGVILDWDFSTVEGNTVKDSSGKGHDGTISGATVADGKATFNGGAEEYVLLPDNLFDGYSANDTVTIELVLNPVETNDYTTFMHFGESDQNFVALAIMGNRNLRYATKGMEQNKSGEISVNSGNSPLTLNANNTVKYVLEPNVTTIYVNDAYVTKRYTNRNYFIGNVDSKAKLGGKAFWNDPCFKGSIDSVKITVEQGTAVAVDPAVKPSLEATTGTVLGYVNFAQDDANWVNVKEVASNVTVAGGVATFTGVQSNNVNDVTNAIVFESALLSDIKSTLTIEMVVKPEEAPDNGCFMSIGNTETSPYLVMGTVGNPDPNADNGNRVKFNEMSTAPKTLVLNEWVTLKYVVTKTSTTIYVNGVPYAEGAGVNLAKVKAATERIKFGQRTIEQWNDPSYKGQVSEIRITTSTINPYKSIAAGLDADALSEGESNPSKYPFEVSAEDENFGGVDNSYNGAWMKYESVDFGDLGADSIAINYLTKKSRMVEDAKAEIWIGGMTEDDGTCVATIELPTVESEKYEPKTATADLDPEVVKGVQDVYIVLTGTCNGTTDDEYIARVKTFGFTEAAAPIQVMPPEFTTEEIAADEQVTYEAFGVGGMLLTIQDADAYVIHNGVTYSAENGVVTVPLTGSMRMPSKFVIGNSGSTAESYTVTFAYPLGHMANPEVITENGNYSALIAAGETAGYNYTWTAPSDGTVVITMSNNNTNGWAYVANNITSSAYGDINCSSDDPAVPSTEYAVKEGDELQINISTLNTDVTGSVNWNFTFAKEGQEPLIEGLNAKAWDFKADDYKTLFGEAANGRNGDTIKATIKAGTGLTARTDCQEIVPVDYVIDADWYAIQYTGVLTVEETGWYQFATDKVDNGYVAYVGGVKVFDFAAHAAWADNDNESTFGETVYLHAGQKYSYEAYFIEQDGGQVASVQVVKADGKLYNCADAGIKFYANGTADNSAPTVWETIFHTITGSIGNNDKEVTGDNTLTIPADATGQVWNYSRGGYTKDSVIKVAFYITVNSVADDVDPEGSNLMFDNNFGEVTAGVEVDGFLDIPNSVFTENVGKKIIVVGVFNHPSEWMEARWTIKNAGISFTVNKVVVGDADTDFDCAAATMGGYTLAFEEANSEDIVYTASSAIKTDDTPSDSTKTGDVASVAAILLAGAAALGGLKLRKKSK